MPASGSLMDASAVLVRLRSMADPKNLKGMARFGIEAKSALGISLWDLRKFAKDIGTDHALALALWDSGIREARMLAASVDDPSQVTEAQMDAWVRDFDSWDVCDTVTTDLFYRTPLASRKALQWSRDRGEFVKRAGFATMAGIAWHDKGANDAAFLPFLAATVRGATDDRNFVRKAVSWALRNVGKRNPALNRQAVATAKRIQKLESRAARWIASDALRELTGEAVQGRLRAIQPPSRRTPRPASGRARPRTRIRARGSRRS
jgi:3-methyladenine DNA glycosylase AlkD